MQYESDVIVFSVMDAHRGDLKTLLAARYAEGWRVTGVSTDEAGVNVVLLERPVETT